MPIVPKAKLARRRPKTVKPYHHGDLKRALIDAALQLVEEGGLEAVSMREAARRAGVSPGAPFRHFPSRLELMTAVAEEAQRRFRAEITDALAQVAGADPLERFRALGIAYLRWALRNPTHFEFISNGKVFDHAGSEVLTHDNAELITLTEQSLVAAFETGMLRTPDIQTVKIAGRALVYGFARMNLDGHFPRWSVSQESAMVAATAVLDLFIDGIRKPGGRN